MKIHEYRRVEVELSSGDTINDLRDWLSMQDGDRPVSGTIYVNHDRIVSRGDSGHV